MRANMKAERVRNGYTIRDVAELIKVHPNAISRWENGDSEPTAGNLIALSHLYGCTPEYLLGMTSDRCEMKVAGTSSSFA